MSRLIDADALEEGKFHSIENWTPIESASWQRGWNDAIDAIIDNAPTVDAVKHGHWWKVIDEEGEGWMCSECLEEWEFADGHPKEVYGCNYCPNCGAKMDEVEE